MKIHKLLITGLTAATLFGCTKEAVKSPAANTTPSGIAASNSQYTNSDAADTLAKHLLGKWSLVKDSTTNSVNQFEGSPVTIKQYLGTDADYYDFRADGNCYISQNGVLKTVAYKVVSNGLLLAGTGAISTVDPLTSHNARISIGQIENPAAFVTTETVYLKK